MTYANRSYFHSLADVPEEWRSLTRFMSKVQVTDTCWLWQGTITVWGYGVVNLDNGLEHTRLRAHRLAYMLLKGLIPADRELDHLCFNRACVNPEHLEAVTQAENTRRRSARLTHCKRGHEYNEVNTYIKKDGARKCRICHRLQLKEMYDAGKRYLSKARREQMVNG